MATALPLAHKLTAYKEYILFVRLLNKGRGFQAHCVFTDGSARLHVKYKQVPGALAHLHTLHPLSIERVKYLDVSDCERSDSQ